MKLRYYKTDERVVEPSYGTEGSACFDIHAFLPENKLVKMYDRDGNKRTIVVEDDSLEIPAGARVLIPTGIIFDIDANYSLRFHMRSSVALKRGLIMPNGEAVIDSDYVEESFIMVYNSTRVPVYIENEERICQGELVANLNTQLEETTDRPIRTTRIGGFGSTGK